MQELTNKIEEHYCPEKNTNCLSLRGSKATAAIFRIISSGSIASSFVSLSPPKDTN
jgi:hypothetical protein